MRQRDGLGLARAQIEHMLRTDLPIGEPRQLAYRASETLPPDTVCGSRRNFH